jgi:hypothetical protein
MTPASLQTNHYLIHLVLSHCLLKDVPEMGNQNLQYLDLSHNDLKAFNTSAVLWLVNLQTLLLSHNPLSSIYGGGSSTKHIQSALRTIDLSFTELGLFRSRAFRQYISVTTLNVSHTPLTGIARYGFTFLPRLTEVDLRHTRVDVFPSDVFQSLAQLHRVEAQNYRLCCKTILPSHLDQRFCSAPQDEISSCDDLLRSGVYRMLTWIICVLSVTGNVFCLAFRSCVQKNADKTAFNLFVSSLGLADLLMGVYMAIIGAADLSFLGRYLLHEHAWVTSGACSAAGFLSLLSSEVSALTILLITLDRFLVLHFPFSAMRFTKTSAVIVSIMIWAVGLFLAAVPLLPVTSHWEFYSQTGICIPLPVTRLEFKGQGYSEAILIFLNFVLFLFIAAGQAFIYWSVYRSRFEKSHEQTVAR